VPVGRRGCAKFLVGTCAGFGHFVEFWVVYWLVIVFRLFWGLKGGFCGEVKCGILGFWFGKREHGRMMELCEVKQTKME